MDADSITNGILYICESSSHFVHEDGNLCYTKGITRKDKLY